MAAEQLTDKETQFKKRARRRLVGAVALVLLMITVLPMVLDDRAGQKSAQPDITISIPSQDGGDFSSKIVPVATEPAKPVGSPVPPPSVPSAQPQSQSQSQPPAVPAPSGVTKQPVQPLTEAKTTASPAHPTEVAAKSTSPQPGVTPAPEKKSTELKPAEIKVAEAKPQQATAEVKAASEKPVISPSKSEIAEPAAQNAAEKTAASPPVAKKGAVSVQIGVFSDAAKVKQMRAKIAEKGIHCSSENLTTPKGVKFRVRCGPYADRPAAQKTLDTLKAAGYSGILVTSQ